MTTRSLAVVSAGIGQPSATRLLADRLADATTSALRGRGVDAILEAVELRPHAHDLTNHLLTGFATDSLAAAKDAVSGADGLIAVSPVYSGAYNGLFKTFFDVLDDGALRGVPVLLGATAGTPRHALALDHAMRPLFAHLGALVVPTGVLAATEDWGATGAVGGALAARIERAAAELAGLVADLPRRSRIDPITDPVPFELLRGD